MHTTNGHEVAVIVGDAAGIRDRGREIEDLGQQMIGAAGILREIGDGASEEKGRSIERIQKEVGDVHEELKLAGDRYKPTGTAMKAYGNQLESVQIAMRRIVRDAEDAKQKLDNKLRAAATAEATVSDPYRLVPEDAESAAAEAELAEAATTAANAVGPARDELNEQFRLFDTEWDTWDAAYHDALTAVNEATDGNVTDDWTDNFAGVVEVALTVLSWVGVALAIAALIVGGPLFAAIAAVVGIIALIGTIFLAMKGRMGKGDVIWAIVGVLPFGKLGKLFQNGKRLKGLTEFFTGPVMEAVTPMRRMRALSGLANNGAGFRAAGLSQRAANGLAAKFSTVFASHGTVFTNFGGGLGGKAIWARIIGGSSRQYAVTFAQNFDNLTAHHQRLVSPHLGVLADVIESGSKNIHVADGIATGVEWGLRRGKQVVDRGNDVIEWAGPNPVDSWRAELTR
jgi:hypothetical protein